MKGTTDWTEETTRQTTDAHSEGTKTLKQRSERGPHQAAGVDRRLLSEARQEPLPEGDGQSGGQLRGKKETNKQQSRSGRPLQAKPAFFLHDNEVSDPAGHMTPQ